MTRVELAERVLRKRSEIKVLIMSGETADAVLNQNTLDAFLPKPFMPSTLLKMRAAALRARAKIILH